MATGPAKLEQLEGLRGIAAFVVLLHHLRSTFFIATYYAVARRAGPMSAVVLEAAFDGTFAVWLFWVLSAFVLSLRYHGTTDSNVALTNLTDATVRRYPRLALPVFASVLFAWALLQAGLMSNGLLAKQLGEEYGWIGSYYAFPPNLLLAVKSALWESFFCYEKESTYNAVLWTMEVELIGSLFLFAFLALVGKHPSRLIFYVLTIAICCALSIQWLNAFMAGAMLSDGYVHRASLRAIAPRLLRVAVDGLSTSRVVAFVCAAVLVPLIGFSQAVDWVDLLLASIVTALAMISHPAAGVLSWRLPVFLGKISFGLYLVHLPIICATAYPLFNAAKAIGSDRLAGCIASLAIMGLSLVGGWCLWYCADRPALNFSRQCAAVLRVNRDRN